MTTSDKIKAVIRADQEGMIELNDWEASFIDDIQYKNPKILSEKQEAIIEKIWDRI